MRDRTPEPPGGSALARCHSRRSDRSGAFLFRWLEASLGKGGGGVEDKDRRQSSEQETVREREEMEMKQMEMKQRQVRW